MEAYLQIWGDAGAEVLAINGDRTVIGREMSNDVPLASDPTVSRVHAVVERYPAGWSIRDLGTINGTYVNGEMLSAEHALHSGDEIRIGATQMVFRTRVLEDSGSTLALAERPPPLTRRERDVLVALCRPVLGTGPFAQPATIAQIAQELFVSEAAVKFHLGNLYDKFDIHVQGTAKRAELAKAALARGAVGRAELRRSTGDDPA